MPESVIGACQKYVGMETGFEVAFDPVERGAVRRFVQATMNEDPIFWADTEVNRAYGGPVAPPLYPAHIFRRHPGTDDPLAQAVANPDFDGLSLNALQGLPAIEPLKDYTLLNGGIEVEFFRYARHGESVKSKSRYVSITEKATSKGPLIIVVLEAEYRTADDELLLKIRRSQLRRK